MSDEIWVSTVKSNGVLGNKLGIRAKYYGHDWEQPTHIVPEKPEGVADNMNRCDRGETLKREEFPEASYVFDEKRWKRSADFFWAGGFIAVKGRLAKIMSGFDLGPGGELIPYPIFKEDKITPFSKEEAYLINFGAPKDCFLPHESESSKVMPFFTLEKHGVENWNPKLSLEDGHIAVSASALEGSDMWIEPKLRKLIFLSGDLVEAFPTKVKRYFELTRCRIVL